MNSAFWIILTGALVGASCGILGCFLVLRRLSLLGDAISHAVLPGIAVAFLLSGSRASPMMFLGAAVVGILTTVLVQALSQGGVQGDAAIGVTFTSLFALGVVLISLFAHKVDLDVECVLYGEIALTTLDVWEVGGVSLGPRAVWINGGFLLLNAAVVYALFKELKICAFDPGMAAAVGIPVAAIHYLLMGLVSVTTVGAFDSVGAVLVVAMLIVPAATAYLLTDRLTTMLGLAAGTGALSSLGGFWLARALDASVAGAMAAVCGAFFTLAFLFSPSHGVVSRWVAHWRLRRQVAEEDLLLWAGRRAEVGAAASPFSLGDASSAMEWLMPDTEAVASRLASRGIFTNQGGSFSLTEAGRNSADQLLRRHRLYESYLGELGYARDHLHAPADRVEHHITADVTEALDAATRFPGTDPQGKPIPPPETRAPRNRGR